MRRAELKELKNIYRALHDNMPAGVDCECYNLDGEKEGPECDFHYAVIQLSNLIDDAEAPKKKRRK